MKKKLSFFILLSGMNTHLWTMEQLKLKSCVQIEAISLYNAAKRAWTTSSLPNGRTFEPFSHEHQQVVRTLFAAKNSTILDRRLNELEEDAHLKEVAARARLGGLCLFLAKKKNFLTRYEAYTADSIAQFIDGTIHHAIAIPEALYIQNNDTTQASIHGMIEREIARISQAYSSDDMEVRQFWHNCGWTGYSLASLVGLYLEPLSIIVSAAGGLVLESIVREGTALAGESSLDTQAAELAQTTDHLMATLTASTHIAIAEIETQRAQNKHKNDQYAESLSLRAQRILNLLKAQDQLDMKE